MALLKAICNASIFIIRIRFPPGTSLATLSVCCPSIMTTNVARTVHGSGILCLAKFTWTTLKTGQFHYFRGSLSVVMATMLIISV